MTEDEFRRLALALPEAVEVGHMGHPDFRVRNKIFATLGYPEPGYGMVKLNVAQRATWIATAPAVFAAVQGGWGKTGATIVHLKPAKRDDLREALAIAWGNVAPKSMLRAEDRSASASASRRRAKPRAKPPANPRN